MSAVAFTALLLLAAAPPPPPSETGDADGAEDEAGTEEAGTEEAGTEEAGVEDAAEDEAGADAEAADAEPAAEPTDELPVDERYDPILPYGEADDTSELEYADEPPPPPELEYGEGSSADSEAVEYDEGHERATPDVVAIQRQSHESSALGEDPFDGRRDSPQRFLMELKFGPYLPGVDSRWTGAGPGPYAMVFGEVDEYGEFDGAIRQGLLSVLGFEWQFINLGGPLSVGTTIGYFRDTADALLAEVDEDSETARAPADEAVFHVIPMTLLLGYRFELLADRFHVPLVPYARGGIAYGFWVATKGGSRTTNSAGEDSRGGSVGWQANLGLMLRMDFLERAVALDLDRLAGINHTYFFGEWQFSRLDGFGSETAMSVGDDTFTVGVAVEF